VQDLLYILVPSFIAKYFIVHVTSPRKANFLATPETQVYLTLYCNRLELDNRGLLQVDTELSEGYAAIVLLVEDLRSKMLLKWL
jgi:hypothetical protein